MRNHIETRQRDRSRRPDAKRCSMTRRADRRRKSAIAFLCIAFPPALAI